MKCWIKKKIAYKCCSVIALLMIVFLLPALIGNTAPTQKKERVRMKLYYYKLAAGDRMVSIGLTAGSGKKMHGVEGDVELSAMVGDSTVTLATLATDTSGLVSLYFAKDYILPQNKEGKTFLQATYNGNNEYRDASNELELMDLDLDISFEKEDSIQYLSVFATTVDQDGEIIPVGELDIYIAVQRLYSNLTIGKMETDESGVGTMEFPNDIPGDEIGELTVIAKVEDSDDFGTVENSVTQNLGIPVSYEVIPLPRQLYTDEAPLWMIIAVIIILMGAWYHFFLSISKLVKLKKTGKTN